MHVRPLPIALSCAQVIIYSELVGVLIVDNPYVMDMQ